MQLIKLTRIGPPGEAGPIWISTRIIEWVRDVDGETWVGLKWGDDEDLDQYKVEESAEDIALEFDGWEPLLRTLDRIEEAIENVTSAVGASRGA